MNMSRMLAAAVVVALGASASGAVRLGAPFTDGMVLQRGRTVPVWGTAAPGENVKVSFAGQDVQTTASVDGMWRVDLPPLAACAEGRDLVANDAVAHDVLVGEVWLASGQSNMSFTLLGGNPRFRDRIGAQTAQKTYRNDLRFVTINTPWSVKRRTDLKVEWKTCRPENLGGVSAVAFWYGLDLRDTLGVPVGVITAAEGGTVIEAWIPPEGYRRHPELDHWGTWPVTENWTDAMKEGAICGPNQQPSVLWNGKLAGLAPYAVKGLIWYQGEHNARPGWALQYVEKMHALVEGFAEAFDSPELSFYYVLIAPFGWMDFAEVQRFQKRFEWEEPRAALTVIHDVGQVNEIHPHDKRTPAERLALHALRRDYGFDVRDRSPSLKTWRVEEGRVRLRFRDARSMYIYTPDNSKEAGFELLDERGAWHPARLANLRATTDGRGRRHVDGDFVGEGILLEAPTLKGVPQGVRYLHAKPFFGCVKNDVDLPLAPFDTQLEDPGLRPPLMVNEDPWYFISHRPASEMNVAGLQAHVDRYAEGGQVTHLLFCVNGMRTAYPSKVTDSFWRTQLEDGTVLEDKEDRMRSFFERGIDPFAVWIDRCREKNISPWISMRINDVHHITSGNPKSSCAFWRRHPELRRSQEDPVTSGKWWTDFAFNFAKPEVRDYAFALFKEIADRYDADGYELDTLRFWEHLTPGHAPEEAHFLTEFILRCRAYTRELEKTRGHRIRLSARVLTSYDASRAYGFDPEAWAREDAIDLLVVGNFFNTVDYEFDFADWVEKIRRANPKTRVLPGATDCFACEPCRLDADAYRGWADQMYAQGACGVYLYNTSYLPDDDKRDLCRKGLLPNAVRAGARRYARTFHDVVPKGLPTGRRLPAPLTQAQDFPVVGGRGPLARDGVSVVLGLEWPDAPAPTVTLNGAKAQGAPEKLENHAKYGPDRKTKTVWRYRFANAAAKPGENRVGVGALPEPKGLLTWVELDFK